MSGEWRHSMFDGAADSSQSTGQRLWGHLRALTAIKRRFLHHVKSRPGVAHEVMFKLAIVPKLVGSAWHAATVEAAKERAREGKLAQEAVSRGDEGDLDLYSEENLRARAHIFHSDLVQAALEELWCCAMSMSKAANNATSAPSLPAGEGDKPVMHLLEYRVFHNRLAQIFEEASQDDLPQAGGDYKSSGAAGNGECTAEAGRGEGGDEALQQHRQRELHLSSLVPALHRSENDKRKEHFKFELLNDWEADSEGTGAINRSRFFKGMFHLADVWVDGIIVEQYVEFLRDLADLCGEHFDEEGRLRFLRSLSKGGNGLSNSISIDALQTLEEDRSDMAAAGDATCQGSDQGGTQLTPTEQGPRFRAHRDRARTVSTDVPPSRDSVDAILSRARAPPLPHALERFSDERHAAHLRESQGDELWRDEQQWSHDLDWPVANDEYAKRMEQLRRVNSVLGHAGLANLNARALDEGVDFSDFPLGASCSELSDESREATAVATIFTSLARKHCNFPPPSWPQNDNTNELQRVRYALAAEPAQVTSSNGVGLDASSAVQFERSSVASDDPSQDCDSVAGGSGPVSPAEEKTRDYDFVSFFMARGANDVAEEVSAMAKEVALDSRGACSVAYARALISKQINRVVWVPKRFGAEFGSFDRGVKIRVPAVSCSAVREASSEANNQYGSGTLLFEWRIAVGWLLSFYERHRAERRYIQRDVAHGDGEDEYTRGGSHGEPPESGSRLRAAPFHGEAIETGAVFLAQPLPCLPARLPYALRVANEGVRMSVSGMAGTTAQKGDPRLYVDQYSKHAECLLRAGERDVAEEWIVRRTIDGDVPQTLLAKLLFGASDLGPVERCAPRSDSMGTGANERDTGAPTVPTMVKRGSMNGVSVERVLGRVLNLAAGHAQGELRQLCEAARQPRQTVSLKNVASIVCKRLNVDEVAIVVVGMANDDNSVNSAGKVLSPARNGSSDEKNEGQASNSLPVIRPLSRDATVAHSRRTVDGRRSPASEREVIEAALAAAARQRRAAQALRRHLLSDSSTFIANLDSGDCGEKNSRIDDDGSLQIEALLDLMRQGEGGEVVSEIDEIDLIAQVVLATRCMLVVEDCASHPLWRLLLNSPCSSREVVAVPVWSTRDPNEMSAVLIARNRAFVMPPALCASSASVVASLMHSGSPPYPPEAEAGAQPGRRAFEISAAPWTRLFRIDARGKLCPISRSDLTKTCSGGARLDGVPGSTRKRDVQVLWYDSVEPGTELPLPRTFLEKAERLRSSRKRQQQSDCSPTDWEWLVRCAELGTSATGLQTALSGSQRQRVGLGWSEAEVVATRQLTGLVELLLAEHKFETLGLQTDVDLASLDAMEMEQSCVHVSRQLLGEISVEGIVTIVHLLFPSLFSASRCTVLLAHEPPPPPLPPTSTRRATDAGVGSVSTGGVLRYTTGDNVKDCGGFDDDDSRDGVASIDSVHELDDLSDAASSSHYFVIHESGIVKAPSPHTSLSVVKDDESYQPQTPVRTPQRTSPRGVSVVYSRTGDDKSTLPSFSGNAPLSSRSIGAGREDVAGTPKLSSKDRTASMRSMVSAAGNDFDDRFDSFSEWVDLALPNNTDAEVTDAESTQKRTNRHRFKQAMARLGIVSVGGEEEIRAERGLQWRMMRISTTMGITPRKDNEVPSCNTLLGANLVLACMASGKLECSVHRAVRRRNVAALDRRTTGFAPSSDEMVPSSAASYSASSRSFGRRSTIRSDAGIRASDGAAGIGRRLGSFRNVENTEADRQHHRAQLDSLLGRMEESNCEEPRLSAAEMVIPIHGVPTTEGVEESARGSRTLPLLGVLRLTREAHDPTGEYITGPNVAKYERFDGFAFSELERRRASYLGTVVSLALQRALNHAEGCASLDAVLQRLHARRAKAERRSLLLGRITCAAQELSRCYTFHSVYETAARHVAKLFLDDDDCCPLPWPRCDAKPEFERRAAQGEDCAGNSVGNAGGDVTPLTPTSWGTRDHDSGLTSVATGQCDPADTVDDRTSACNEIDDMQSQIAASEIWASRPATASSYYTEEYSAIFAGDSGNDEGIHSREKLVGVARDMAYNSAAEIDIFRYDDNNADGAESCGGVGAIKMTNGAECRGNSGKNTHEEVGDSAILRSVEARLRGVKPTRWRDRTESTDSMAGLDISGAPWLGDGIATPPGEPSSPRVPWVPADHSSAIWEPQTPTLPEDRSTFDNDAPVYAPFGGMLEPGCPREASPSCRSGTYVGDFIRDALPEEYDAAHARPRPPLCNILKQRPRMFIATDLAIVQISDGVKNGEGDTGERMTLYAPERASTQDESMAYVWPDDYYHEVNNSNIGDHIDDAGIDRRAADEVSGELLKAPVCLDGVNENEIGPLPMLRVVVEDAEEIAKKNSVAAPTTGQEPQHVQQPRRTVDVPPVHAYDGALDESDNEQSGVTMAQVHDAELLSDLQPEVNPHNLITFGPATPPHAVTCVSLSQEYGESSSMSSGSNAPDTGSEHQNSLQRADSGDERASAVLRSFADKGLCVYTSLRALLRTGGGDDCTSARSSSPKRRLGRNDTAAPVIAVRIDETRCPEKIAATCESSNFAIVDMLEPCSITSENQLKLERQRRFSAKLGALSFSAIPVAYEQASKSTSPPEVAVNRDEDGDGPGAQFEFYRLPTMRRPNRFESNVSVLDAIAGANGAEAVVAVPLNNQADDEIIGVMRVLFAHDKADDCAGCGDNKFDLDCESSDGDQFDRDNDEGATGLALLCESRLSGESEAVWLQRLGAIVASALSRAIATTAVKEKMEDAKHDHSRLVAELDSAVRIGMRRHLYAKGLLHRGDLLRQTAQTASQIIALSAARSVPLGMVITGDLAVLSGHATLSELDTRMLDATKVPQVRSDLLHVERAAPTPLLGDSKLYTIRSKEEQLSSMESGGPGSLRDSEAVEEALFGTFDLITSNNTDDGGSGPTSSHPFSVPKNELTVLPVSSVLLEECRLLINADHIGLYLIPKESAQSFRSDRQSSLHFELVHQSSRELCSDAMQPELSFGLGCMAIPTGNADGSPVGENVPPPPFQLDAAIKAMQEGVATSEPRWNSRKVPPGLEESPCSGAVHGDGALRSAYFLVPILVTSSDCDEGSYTAGVLQVSRRDVGATGEGFNSQDVRVARAMANAISVDLQNWLLWRETLDTLEKGSAVLRAGQLLSLTPPTMFDLPTLLRGIAHEALIVVPCDLSLEWVYDRKLDCLYSEIILPGGAHHVKRTITLKRESDSIIWQVFCSKRARRLFVGCNEIEEMAEDTEGTCVDPDLDAKLSHALSCDDDGHAATDYAFCSRSACYVPYWGPTGTVLGVSVFINRRRSRADVASSGEPIHEFCAQDEKLLSKFVRLMGVAVHQAFTDASTSFFPNPNDGGHGISLFGDESSPASPRDDFDLKAFHAEASEELAEENDEDSGLAADAVLERQLQRGRSMKRRKSVS